MTGGTSFWITVCIEGSTIGDADWGAGAGLVTTAESAPVDELIGTRMSPWGGRARMGVGTPTAVAEEDGRVGAEGRLEADGAVLVAGFSMRQGTRPKGKLNEA